MTGIEAGLILGATAAVGTGVQIAGQLSEALARKEYAREQARIANLQATELLERQVINEGILRERGEELITRIGGSTSGLATSGVGQILKVKQDIEQNILLSRRDAEFKAQMIREGAEAQMELESDRFTGSILTGVGTGIVGGVGLYNQLKPSRKPEKY